MCKEEKDKKKKKRRRRRREERKKQGKIGGGFGLGGEDEKGNGREIFPFNI